MLPDGLRRGPAIARTLLLSIGLVSHLWACPPARAAEPLQADQLSAASPGRDTAWVEQPGLTGDWGGLRAKLQDVGITPGLTFVSDVLGNPTGGQRQGLRETDNLGLDLVADLEKLAGWPAAQFHLSTSLRSGRSLSGADIGNVFTVAQVCCGHTFRLVNVDLEQSFLDGAVSLRGGRIAAGDDFLASPLYGYFVQSAINGNPSGITFNVPISLYPVATWGIRARVTPVRQVSLMVGAYNGDPSLGRNSAHGVDWTMRGPLFAIGEIVWQVNQEPGAAGLPGNYKLGGYYQGGSAPDLSRDVEGGATALSELPPRLHTGNGGFYVLADQMVYRDGGPESPRSLTSFASLLFAPDTHINVMPFFVNGGLVYRGALPSRPQDAAALGVAYGAFSHQLARSQQVGGAPVQRYELALELTYIVQATRWMQIQPDVQYIIRPGGTGRIPDALVLGFQIALTF